MTRILGPSLSKLDETTDAYNTVIMKAIRRTLKHVSDNIDPTLPVDSLTITTDYWRSQVDDSLAPAILDIWTGAATDVYAHLQHAVNRVTTAAVYDPDDVPEPERGVAPVIRSSDEHAQEYLASRQNYLVGLGDEVWEVLRGEVLDAMDKGEGIGEIRDRITASTSLLEPRALRVARTETVNAANAGAIAQMRDSGMNGTKEWVAKLDSRTREDHHDADGQTVALDETFTVGGQYMDRPGDGPASQVVNCRCTLVFNVDEEDLDLPDFDDLDELDELDDDDVLVSAARADGEEQTGAMIALVPSDEDSERLVLENGEPRDDLHLTLWFLGEAADIPQETRDRMIAAAEDALESVYGGNGVASAVYGRAFGAAHWNPGGDWPAWVLSVGDNPEYSGQAVSLSEIRNVVGDAALDGVDSVPAQHTPWVPHLTLTYDVDTSLIDAVESRLGEVVFDRLRFAFAGEVHDIPLSRVDDAVTAAGGGAMPYTTVEGHAECADEGKPWAVVLEGDDADGESFGCYATEAEADDRAAELNAEEQDEDGDDESFTVQRTNGRVVAQAELSEADATASQVAPWSGTIVVEGVVTGDGREFAPDALTWADLPLPLRWNIEDSHGGEPRTVAVNVGRIDTLRREENRIVATGVFNLGSENGRAAHQLVAGQFLRGISVDVDDIADADVEMIFPEETDDADPLDMLFMMPEKVIFHGGRVRAATLCDIAAFVEAEIQLDETVVAASAARGREAMALTAASTSDADVIDIAQRYGAQFVDDAPRPPRSWFDNPNFSVYTPIIVTDEGRVYGHAGQWGMCHVGIEDVCTEMPHEDHHSYYMTGETICADGSRVATGPITADTGHAPLRMGARAAAEHYDNTGAVVADVVIGNDAHGIWVAGALRSGADAKRVRNLRGSGQLSGDWRRIAGQLRMVALLAVNAGGYAVPKTGVHVASGVPQAIVAAGPRMTLRPQWTDEDLVQMGYRALKKHLMERVNGKK